METKEPTAREVAAAKEIGGLVEKQVIDMLTLGKTARDCVVLAHGYGVEVTIDIFQKPAVTLAPEPISTESTTQEAAKQPQHLVVEQQS